VPQGLVVRLYEHYHFQGRFIDIKEDTPAVSQFWNDRTSSIIVYGDDEQPPVTREVMIFEHANHTGRFQILPEGSYDLAQILIGNDTLSSALVPSGMKLRLYEHANFQGAFIDIREDTKAVSLDWNDRASSIVVTADFPENEVVVSREYIPTERGKPPSKKIAEEIGAKLPVPGIQKVHPRSNKPLTFNAAALKRIRARGLLHFAFLGPLATFLDRLDTVHTQLGGHDFGGAETAIGAIPDPITLPNITVEAIEEAFAGNNLPYMEIILRGPANEPNDEIIFHTLEGYRGFVLDARAALELVAGGRERDFRLNLLKGEINFGRGDFKAAISFYDTLLTATPFDDPRHKFLALRAGFAHLGHGDSIFRKSRSASHDLSEAVKEYDEAIRVVAENAVSLENPLAKEIVDYANQKKSKIEGGFNFLGLTDGFVPIETVEFLRERTHAHLAIAKQAAHDFETYLEKANALEDVEAELGLELNTAEKSLEIAVERIQNAEDKIRDTNEALEDLADKQDFLTAEAVVFGIESFIQAAQFSIQDASSGGTGGGGEGGANGLEAVDGFSRRIISFFARANELSHQKARAEIQRRIAEREKAIEMLQRDIVELRRDFVEDKLRTTQGRDLNKDLYYKLANFFAQLTARHIEVALQFAYLFERAVAFRFRKPDLRVLPNFDFNNSSTEGIMVGGRKLESIVALIEDEAVPASEIDSFPLDISLRARYPIEFSLFQQTGRMEFALSLYDLDKARPGTYNRRIIAVAVQPIGLIPPTGYSGTLTHPGTFLIRDLVSTLDTATQRFIPTDERLAAAFAELQDGKVPGAAVDGVVPFQLDPDTKQLSVETEELIEVGSPQASTVKLFERYGAATLWTLELSGLDPRQLTDIRFKLRLEHPETEPDLRQKVEKLIQAYEVELATANGLDTALDRITAVSMRDQFRDEFLQLATGEASFELKQLHFPFGLTDLKVKTVITQAIDFNQDGAPGVQLKIAKDSTVFTLDRTTGANGFSEDITGNIPVLEQAERFPVLGTWHIQLSDPEQFDQVFRNPEALKEGDLLFFFVYEFKEV
jgi:tetratricopeptide (TPR) repeat protein